jgi:uncharacterized delta-60 repeat protein
VVSICKKRHKTTNEAVFMLKEFMLKESVCFKTMMILMFGFVVLSASSCMAAPTIEWEKCFGGSEDDGVESVEQTSDGGYIVAGYSKSADGDLSQNHGGFDAWVFKLKDDGTLDWQKSLGGSGHDEAYSIYQTKDGGFVVAGSSDSQDGDVSGNHGGKDFWVVKLTPHGEIEWQKSLGGSGEDIARSVQQTDDGGYILAGESDSQDGDVSGNHGKWDGWVVKLKPNGELEWQKSFGDYDFDRANSIRQTSDGGFVFAGLVSSRSKKHSKRDMWVVKLKSNGSLEWEKRLGGSESEEAQSIQETSDGGYIVAGNSDSNDGDVSGIHGGMILKGFVLYPRDFWVVKLHADGAIAWQRILGGSEHDFGRAVQQTVDGGYIVTGYTKSEEGDISENRGRDDFWVVKLKTDGTLDWQKSLGGSDTDRAYDIAQTKDGGYIVVGSSNSSDGDISARKYKKSNAWIVKLKADQDE